MAPKYLMTGEGSEASIIVYIPGQEPLVALSSHPSFRAIAEAAIAGDEDIASLFDIKAVIERSFEQLSERVAIVNDEVTLDGVALHGTLVENILDSLSAGADDLSAQVNFLENLSVNPNPDAVAQLYDWLAASDGFTLDNEGMIRGYKAVQYEDGAYRSIHSGKARVNGVEQVGRIPQNIGDVVTMPRDEVQDDPSRGCSTGLHVGTYEYARGFGGNGPMLEVAVNPRDVVSVPTECSAQKMRVCRYTVVGTIAAKYDTPVVGLDRFDLLTSSSLWGDGEGEDDETDFFFGIWLDD